jgi:hypothetical protein
MRIQQLQCWHFLALLGSSHSRTERSPVRVIEAGRMSERPSTSLSGGAFDDLLLQSLAVHLIGHFDEDDSECRGARSII